ncbi:MAG: ABC transporter ATP-binding protein [Alphaproteobacteria bacterium]
MNRSDPVRRAVAAADQGAALELHDLHLRFDDVVAVESFNLSVAGGEVVCLLGPSGCGKTTVLRIAAGLETPDRGQVVIASRTVTGEDVDVPPEDRGVGLVFQDYALFPHLSVAENVGFGLRGGAADAGRVQEVLAALAMADLAGRYPHMLSGGQQQRVALARALAPGPEVVLLDEPFSGLDARLRDKVRDHTLHALKESGAATLMVTHDAEEAMFMGDRIAVMRAGRIVQTGTPDELYGVPAEAYVAELFGEVNRLEAAVAGGTVDTPFGRLPAHGMADGDTAQILIRPEALSLSASPGKPEARVIAARMLGRTSLVHLSVSDGTGDHIHLHARAAGRYLPVEGDVVSVALDSTQAFVFPAEDIK